MQKIKTNTVSIPLTRSYPGRAIGGKVYGSGKKAVIFSNMDTNDQTEWAPAIEQVASGGYMILTYDYLQQMDDQSGVLEDVTLFAKESGAEETVLIGASRGGVASLKVAAGSDGTDGITGVAALSAPIEYEGTVFYSNEELCAIKIPTLLVNSEGDDGADDTRRMHTLFTEPKELVIYPGSAHGTELFDQEESLARKLKDFVGFAFSHPH